jgi:hypothetical protein
MVTSGFMSLDLNRGLADPNPEPAADEPIDELQSAHERLASGAPVPRAQRRRGAESAAVTPELADTFNKLVLDVGSRAEAVLALAPAGPSPALLDQSQRLQNLIERAGKVVLELRKKEQITWRRPTTPLFVLSLVVLYTATHGVRQRALAGAALVALVRFGHKYADDNVVRRLKDSRHQEILRLIDLELKTYREAARLTIHRICSVCKVSIRLGRPACSSCKRPLVPVGSTFERELGHPSAEGPQFIWACPADGRERKVPLRHQPKSGSCGCILRDPCESDLRVLHLRALKQVRRVELLETPSPEVEPE